MALTAKQQRFVDEYLVDLNATQAALRAGYSPRSARSIGPELLEKPAVAQAVAAAVGERAGRTGITQDRVVEELSNIAFAQAGDRSDAGLKVSNKLKALELLGKHLGMFDGRGAQAPDRETGVALLPEVRGDTGTGDDGRGTGANPHPASPGAPFLRGPDVPPP